jgi:hypothetical protein
MMAPLILEARRHPNTPLAQRFAYAVKGAVRFVIDSAAGHDEKPIVHPIQILSAVDVALPLIGIVPMLASVVLHDQSLIDVAEIESHPPAAILASDDQVHGWLGQSGQDDEKT